MIREIYCLIVAKVSNYIVFCKKMTNVVFFLTLRIRKNRHKQLNYCILGYSVKVEKLDNKMLSRVNFIALVPEGRKVNNPVWSVVEFGFKN